MNQKVQDVYMYCKRTLFYNCSVMEIYIRCISFSVSTPKLKDSSQETICSTTKVATLHSNVEIYSTKYGNADKRYFKSERDNGKFNNIRLNITL